MSDQDDLLRPRPRVQFRRGYPGKWINLTRRAAKLPPAEKQALWMRMKSERPALAGLLQEPDFRALAQQFDADIYIEEGSKS